MSLRLSTPPEGHSYVECDSCNGVGTINHSKHLEIGEYDDIEDCDNCDGAGEVIDSECDCAECNEERYADHEDRMERMAEAHYRKNGGVE